MVRPGSRDTGDTHALPQQFIYSHSKTAGMVLTNAPADDAGSPALVRSDFPVTTIDGQTIHVREIRPPDGPGEEPLILVHGARVPGIASFDLDVPHGSLAADLASRLGRTVYIMDARGYGGSSRSVAMDKPPGESPPLSRAYEVVRDIDAVVREALRRNGGTRVGLFGWATGGMWAAYYASLWPDRVGHLVMLNTLYGGASEHPAIGPGSPISDPEHPDRFTPDAGGYALNDSASLLPSWDRSIPSTDKADWRDPAVAEAYAKAALQSDPLSDRHSPPAFRAPTRAYATTCSAWKLCCQPVNCCAVARNASRTWPVTVSILCWFHRKGHWGSSPASPSSWAPADRCRPSTRSATARPSRRACSSYPPTTPAPRATSDGG